MFSNEMQFLSIYYAIILNNRLHYNSRDNLVDFGSVSGGYEQNYRMERRINV